MHGHRLTREAELLGWNQVKPGSVYSVLRRLRQEGLIVALRTEQVGLLPPRTVFGLTEAGVTELDALLREALRQTDLDFGVSEVAFLVIDATVTPERRDELIGQRVGRIRALRDAVAAARREAPPESVHGNWSRLIRQHIELRLETDARWHDMIKETLDDMDAERGQAADNDRAGGDER
jgi:DNA-binding PadR family transcriptional regulator